MESGAKILIELAKERHRNKDVKFKPSKPPPEQAERRRTVKFSPQDFDRCVKSEDELIAKLGRKWRSNLVKIGQFASYCKRKATKEQVTLADGSQIDVPMLSIACTNVVLANIFKNTREVNRLIDASREIGLLVRVTQTYRFGSKDKEHNYPYRYAYNEAVGELIRATCLNRKITIPRYQWNKDRTEEIILGTGSGSVDLRQNEGTGAGTGTVDLRQNEGTGTVDSQNQMGTGMGMVDTSEDIREGQPASTTSFSSLVDRFADVGGVSPDEVAKISLDKRYIGVKDIKDREIKEVVWRKYRPLIKPMEVHIALMNTGLPLDEQIRFEPNVKRDRRGIVKRIGWRATNSIVSMKADDNDNPDYKGRWRKDYLESHFKGKPYFEYDVRASIYQITHLLNFNEWVGNRCDPYEKMYGGKFAGKEDRDAYKSFCMSLYFDLPSTIITHNRLRIPQCLARYGKDRLKEVIRVAEENMVRFTGRKLYNEVFLHESLLYIDFVNELRLNRNAFDTVQVYDGFYIPTEACIGRDELDEIMEMCAKSYYCKYKEWKRASGTDGRTV